MLGLALVAAGSAKFLDPATATVLPAFAGLRNSGLATGLSTAVVVLELVIGSLLLLGRLQRIASVSALTLTTVFSLYHVGCAVFGCSQPSCGCLGDVLRTGQAAAAILAGLLLLLSWYVVTSLRA